MDTYTFGIAILFGWSHGSFLQDQILSVLHLDLDSILILGLCLLVIVPFPGWSRLFAQFICQLAQVFHLQVFRLLFSFDIQILLGLVKFLVIWLGEPVGIACLLRQFVLLILLELRALSHSIDKNGLFVAVNCLLLANPVNEIDSALLNRLIKSPLTHFIKRLLV